jgi:hypothetical protein
MARSDRVYDYRDLSQWSYDLANAQPKQVATLPNGWSIVDSTYDNGSEFGAAIFRNDLTKEVVVSFRGTEKTFRDWQTNFAMARPGYKPEEFNIAERYIEQAMANAPEGYNIRTTGHSQGAALAHYMGLKHDVPSVGFNTAPGNIYLNEIYKTLPNGGTSSHIDIRSSVDGERGIPGVNSDVVSGLDSPVTHPVGAGLTMVSPSAGLGAQGYMDPIAKVDPIYLQTGCTDTGMCHSLSNFDDQQLDRVREQLGGDILPDSSIIGGEDKIKACLPTRDVTEGITLGDVVRTEAQNETEKAVDLAGDKINQAVDAAKEAVSEAAGAVKDTAVAAAGAAKDAAMAVVDATKEAAVAVADAATTAAAVAKEAAGAAAAMAKDAGTAVVDAVEEAADAAKGAAGNAMGWAKGKVSNFLDSAPESPPWADGGGGASGSLGPSAAAGDTIVAMEDQADDLAQEADGHADRAASAARRAQSAATRAAAIAARIRAMMSRRYA